MPQTVTGNVDRDPVGTLASLILALAVDGVILDATGRTGPIQDCTDSGSPNAGDGGGNLVLVTCIQRHGLNPGDTVTLGGTPYDGDHEIEPASDVAFYLLNTPYTCDSTGGEWN